MPDSGSYSLTLGHPAPSLRLPAKMAALFLAAGLGIAALTQIQPRAGHPSLSVLSPPPAIEAPAPVAQVSSQAVGPAESEAPALVAETSSIQVEAPAPPAPSAFQPAQQPLAQTAPQTAAVPAPAAPPAEAPAPAASSPGSRWASDGVIFVLEGQDWDADSIANVDGALSHLPARIRLMLGNRALGDINVLINRTGSVLSGKQPYGGPANFFSTNDGHNELVMFPGQSVPTILHELGHAYNLRRIAAGRYALVLLDPEMQSFMSATGWRVLSTPDEVRSARDQIQVQFAYDGSFTWPRLSHNDPLEDFANSFSLYFYAPQDLQQKSPERFTWFEANVGR